MLASESAFASVFVSPESPAPGVLEATVAMWRRCEQALDQALVPEGNLEARAERRLEAAQVHHACGAFEMARDLIDDALSLAPSEALTVRLRALRHTCAGRRPVPIIAEG